MDNPGLLAAPLTLVVCTAILSTALMRSDVHHRSETVIDPLTGMLNRKALTTRVAELEQQSIVSGEPIGLVVGDLDRFKEVNDSCGHATGDAVLKEVAYEMRKELRAFDLAYRLGGEEFLVVLPGADASQAERLAERLRESIAGSTSAATSGSTMSFGVSASPRGEQFDYQDVFGEADMALFEAKRAGRDRVCTGRRGARSRRRPERVVRGAVEYGPVDQPPRKVSPFRSLEATSRELLLAETAEAWYHFGDAPDVQTLLELVDDSLDDGGHRLAAALIFAVLSSDDTAPRPQPERSAEPAAQPLVDLRVVQQRQVVRAAHVHAVLRARTGCAGRAPRPEALASSTSASPSSRPSGWLGLRVSVAATKQCVAPSSSGTSVTAAARRASRIAVAPVLVHERALAQVADAGAAAAQHGAEGTDLRAARSARRWPRAPAARAARPCGESRARPRARTRPAQRASSARA